MIEVLPSGEDKTPPTVKWTRPADGEAAGPSVQVATGATGALYTPYIQIQFSEPMAAGTINSTTVEVKNEAGQVVPISVQYDPTLDQAVALMHAPGAANATYTVTVKPAVTDLAGNPLAAFSWSCHFGQAAPSTRTLYLPNVVR